MKMAKWSKVSTTVGVLAMAAAIGLSGEMAVSAQAPTQARLSSDAQAFNACTTTDYASVAATALNTTAAALRKSLVSGQTLQQIATAANVDVKTVSDAIAAARKTEIDQAVTAGLLTQAEATTLEATPSAPNGNGGQVAPGGQQSTNGDQGAAPSGQDGPSGPGNGGPAGSQTGGQGSIIGQAGAPNGNAGQGNGGPAGGQGGRGQGGPGGQAGFGLPDISSIPALLAQTSGITQTTPNNRRGGGIGFGGASFNLVKPDEVAAQALDMKCTDLVKTLLTGKSIQDVATAQSVDPQTVITAVTKAYTDALAKDVTDGVITQAQADTLSANVAKNAATFVSNSMATGQPPAPAAAS